MFEAMSLIVFAGIFYLLLIAVPSLIEKMSDPEFKTSYLKYLSKTDLHSYGKSYF